MSIEYTPWFAPSANQGYCDRDTRRSAEVAEVGPQTKCSWRAKDAGPGGQARRTACTVDQVFWLSTDTFGDDEMEGQ